MKRTQSSSSNKIKNIKQKKNGTSSKSVSLDILFSGFGSNSRPNSASHSRPSSASKYTLNSPNYTSYINYERPKSVPYGNEYYRSDPYDILLPQPQKNIVRKSKRKEDKSGSKKAKRANNKEKNSSNIVHNINEYKTNIIDEALVFPKKVNLKLPNFKRQNKVCDINSDDEDNELLLTDEAYELCN